jgi:hypothetical protein
LVVGQERSAYSAAIVHGGQKRHRCVCACRNVEPATDGVERETEESSVLGVITTRYSETGIIGDLLHLVYGV